MRQRLVAGLQDAPTPTPQRLEHPHQRSRRRRLRLRELVARQSISRSASSTDRKSLTPTVKRSRAISAARLRGPRRIEQMLGLPLAARVGRQRPLGLFERGQHGPLVHQHRRIAARIGRGDLGADAAEVQQVPHQLRAEVVGVGSAIAQRVQMQGVLPQRAAERDAREQVAARHARACGGRSGLLLGRLDVGAAPQQALGRADAAERHALDARQGLGRAQLAHRTRWAARHKAPPGDSACAARPPPAPGWWPRWIARGRGRARCRAPCRGPRPAGPAPGPAPPAGFPATRGPRAGAPAIRAARSSCAPPRRSRSGGRTAGPPRRPARRPRRRGLRRPGARTGRPPSSRRTPPSTYAGSRCCPGNSCPACGPHPPPRRRSAATARRRSATARAPRAGWRR